MKSIHQADLEAALKLEMHVDEAHGFPAGYTVAQLAEAIYDLLPDRGDMLRLTHFGGGFETHWAPTWTITTKSDQ